MTDVGAVEALVEQADMIVSICPPAEALAVADLVAGAGFDGVYVDANAVSPDTARAVGERFGRFVDGAVVGAPVRAGGSTRLYVSGPEAEVVAARWSGSALEVVVVEGDVGRGVGLEGVLRRVVEGHRRLPARDPRTGAGGRGGGAAARGMVAFTTGPRATVRARRVRQRGESLAVRRGDARERGRVRGARAA